MELIYFVLGAILSVAVVYIGSYFFKQYRVVDYIDITEQILRVVRIIVHKFAGKEFKDKFDLIQEIALTVVEHVEIIATFEDNAEKKQYALDCIIYILREKGFEVTIDDVHFIDKIIDKVVEMLPDTYK